VWIACALFAAVYAFSLTFVYIDPDDASSIAYHVSGRDASIQQPFEQFQFGVDCVLSYLSSDEVTVRIAAKLITVAAAIGSFILLLALSFAIIGDVTPVDKVIITAALFFAAPELIYLGLIYTPIMVGVCCILSAHLILRVHVLRMHTHRELNVQCLILVIISAVLMAFGGFCRWDLCLYGLFVLLDLLYLSAGTSGSLPRDNRKLIWLGLGWGIASAAFWVLMVLGSGGFQLALKDTMGAVAETKGETATGFDADILRAVGADAMLLTPAFVCAAVLGWISMLKANKRYAWFIVLVMVLVIFWPFRLSPKEYYVFLPFFILIAVKGFSLVWRRVTPIRHKNIVRVGFALLLAIPWVVGVRLTYGDSSWGPGFELRPFDRADSGAVRVLSVRPVAGAAFPTSEGPRPVMGHAFVLFGGGWRTLVKSLSDDRISALHYAVDKKLPFLSLMHYDQFQVAELAEMGFTTRDSERWGFLAAPVVRKFLNKDGRSLTLVRLKLSRLLTAPSLLDSLESETANDRFVVWGEPGVMRELYLVSKESFERLGPCTAVLNLRSLHSALRVRK
jgi:hypothetical protein